MPQAPCADQPVPIMPIRNDPISGDASSKEVTLASDPSWTLVIDLDGTLTPTDTLVESVVHLIKRKPMDALRLPWQLLKGRAAFKEFVASHVAPSVEHLPVRAALLDRIRDERDKGRRVILATAANHRIAQAVAAQIGLFDDVIASDGARNLKGAEKLAAIRELTHGNFVYAGDTAADLPIWDAARAAILVGVSPSLAATVRGRTSVDQVIPGERAGIRVWLKALRVHQWLKNGLVLVPLLTAFSFLEPNRLLAALGAFMAFSLAASATYLINDTWDIDSDRAHPRKRQRAIASGQISVLAAISVAACALITAFLLASFVSRGFVATLILYVAMTSTYSWVLKRYVLIDVLTLSLLYTLRILAGSFAIHVETSSWLLAFSVFIFFSLALVKRCSELVGLERDAHQSTRGRDYAVSDLVVLWPLGIAAAMCSVVVFGLFISAPETQARYLTPQMLWLVAVALIYWLSRLWIKTARGQMHDDPLVFAVRDRGSRLTMVAIVAITLVAHYVRLGPV